MTTVNKMFNFLILNQYHLILSIKIINNYHLINYIEEIIKYLFLTNTNQNNNKRILIMEVVNVILKIKVIA
jgi:hypothetical protein